jgi:thiol:disulfide interchange protein DsbA
VQASSLRSDFAEHWQYRHDGLIIAQPTEVALKHDWLKTAFLALVLAAAATAASAQIQVGREFNRLDPPRPVATGSRIELIEFFYYGCPVCYETQPLLSRWLVTAPEYVEIRRVPAMSSENWEPFAKLFYALEALEQIGRLHWPIYDSIHFEGVMLNDEKVMADWVSRNGVERQTFIDAYNSPAVRAKVNAASEMIKVYNVRGVPTFVIDGKYLTSARLAGSTQQVMQVLDELVKRARQERPN